MKIFKSKKIRIKKVFLGLLAVALVALPTAVIALSPVKASAAAAPNTELYEHSPELTYTEVLPTKEGEYLSGVVASNSTQNYKYTFGKPEGWKSGDPYFAGIDYEGFRIKGGNVLIEVRSYVDMKGPIHVDGGNLLVRIANETQAFAGYNDNGGAFFKRNIAYDLRNAEDKDGGYIPVNAAGYNANGERIYQYSGALFVVNKGSVEIVAGAYDSSTGKYTYIDSGKYAYVSGAGQFSMNINDSTLDTGGLNFPDPGAKNGVPYTNTVDDVQAEGPLFLINDNAPEGSTNHAVVKLYQVSLRHNYNAYYSGKTGTDGKYLEGENPYNAEHISYTTVKNKDATYGKRADDAPYPDISMVSNGGAMFVDGVSPRVHMVNSEIQKCYSEMSSAVIHFTGDGGDVDFINTNMFNCATLGRGESTGGTIRAMGSNSTNFSLTNCQMYKNWAKNTAGAINWGSMNTTKPLRISGCEIRDNASYSGYAALNCASRLELSNTKITGNKTVTGSGGGIGFSVWNSATSYNSFALNYDANLVIGEGVEIRNNSAKYGGAIYLTSSLIKVGTNYKNDATHPEYYREFPTKGYYDENNEFHSTGEYSMSLYIHPGAIIENNTSTEAGGAIYMTRNGTAPLYNVKAYILGGTIQNNTSGKEGGACYLTGNNLDLVMSGGVITGNSSTTSGGAI